MFKVLQNEELAPDVHRLVVEAPLVAAAREPGQFVIVRPEEGAERIPLTIAHAEREQGTITLVVQAVGHTTRLIAETPVGGGILDVAGPLGKPTEIRNWGKVVCIGGGVGTAVLYPLAEALAEAGNHVVTIIGGRTEKHLIMRDELAAISDELLLTTEDGSAGARGFVTAELEKLLSDQTTRPDAVYAVGPVPMMAAVADMTRPHSLKTIVSLNPIMVDGTGMCGGCRVSVGDEVKFACVDGPEFNAHQVDFSELSTRQRTYQEEYCRLDEQLRDKEKGK